MKKGVGSSAFFPSLPSKGKKNMSIGKLPFERVIGNVNSRGVVGIIAKAKGGANRRRYLKL